MRLSEDKISHLAHLLADGAQKENLITCESPLRLLNSTKKVLLEYFRLDDEIDQAVRKKISTYKRGVYEGSREWDILYKKHFDEEMKKR